MFSIIRLGVFTSSHTHLLDLEIISTKSTIPNVYMDVIHRTEPTGFGSKSFGVPLLWCFWEGIKLREVTKYINENPKRMQFPIV